MKKLNLLALALAIGTMSLFAKTTNGITDIPVKLIGSQILSLFETPDFNVDEDLNVIVMFTFDSEGKIIVLKVDSQDKNVLNYVKKSLNHKMIQTPGEINRVFTLPLKIVKYSPNKLQ